MAHIGAQDSCNQIVSATFKFKDVACSSCEVKTVLLHPSLLGKPYCEVLKATYCGPQGSAGDLRGYKVYRV